MRAVETPEGCVLYLRTAGPVARARAWIVDFGIRVVIYMGVGSVLPILGPAGVGLFLVFAFLLEWGYPIAFEVWRDGQTPGKRLCGLTVVHDDGTPVGASASIVRNMLRAVDFLPVGYLVAGVRMIVAGDGRRLGDVAAGTLVVHVDAAQPSTPTWADRASEAPRVPLTARERRAVVDFAARLPTLSPSRAEELARVAAPLVADTAGVDATTRLVRTANAILGVTTEG